MPQAGFEPRNPSKRAAADPSLRPRGNWDRHPGFKIIWYPPSYAYVFHVGLFISDVSGGSLITILLQLYMYLYVKWPVSFIFSYEYLVYRPVVSITFVACLPHLILITVIILMLNIWKGIQILKPLMFRTVQYNNSYQVCYDSRVWTYLFEIQEFNSAI